MTLPKLHRTDLRDNPSTVEVFLHGYRVMLEAEMAKEGLGLSPQGEWVEIEPLQPTLKQPTLKQPTLFDRLAGKISTACCAQRDCFKVVAWSFVVGVLASCAAWLSLPILLGWLVFIAFNPKDPT